MKTHRLTYRQRQVLVYAFECLCACLLGLVIAAQPVIDERINAAAGQDVMFVLLDQAVDQLDSVARK